MKNQRRVYLHPPSKTTKKTHIMPLDLTPQTPPYYTIDENLPTPPSITIASIYRATLSQAGTDAPVATVATSSTLTGIVWTRTGVGIYIGTKAAAFPANKTFITTTPQGTGAVGQIQCYRTTENTIEIDTYTVGTSTPVDDRLLDWNIEITITT